MPFHHKLTDADPGGVPGEVAQPWVPANLWITSNPATTPPADRNRVNALHANLIPAGPHRGRVLVWDGNLTSNVGVRTHQPWSIVDPNWVPNGPGHRFYNGALPMPMQGSVPVAELFCCGQTWTADGRLMTAGGTSAYPVPGVSQWRGAKLVYQWDPLTVTWHRMPQDLFVERWYPSLATDGTDDRIGIFGGTDDYDPNHPNPASAGLPATDPRNHYESYRITFNRPTPLATWEQKIVNPGATPRLYSGPLFNPAPPYPRGLTDYPRIHVLTTGQWVVSGFFTRDARWTHDPTQDPSYSTDTGQIPPGYDVQVHYGTSLLYPNLGGIHNRLVRIGGRRHTVTPGLHYASSLVEVSYATTPGDVWNPSALPAMAQARDRGNVVILPNGMLFVIGGYTDDAAQAFNLTPEVLVNNQWSPMAAHAGGRAYHSCAILLPDGRILSCGGEGRSWDYQIWSPPYLTVPGLTRPQGVQLWYTSGGLISDNAIGAITWNGVYRASWSTPMPMGVAVEKIVMMRPMAQTHHDDGGQRYVELTSWTVEDAEDSRYFKAPVSRFHAPPGWYMVFLVTNQGVPANAVWVHLR